MSNKYVKLLKNHPTVTQISSLKSICQPLKERFDISYFAHVNVDKKHNLSCLSTDPDYVHYYMSNAYCNYDVHLLDGPLEEELVLHDTVEKHGESARMFKDAHDHKIRNIFSIIHRTENATEAFHFAREIDDNSKNADYLSNLHQLKQFILHFKELVFTQKGLRKAYDIHFPLQRNAKYQSTINYTDSKPDPFALEKFYLPSSKTYLTLREMQCISMLKQGLTLQESAERLNITERTVRAHLNNVKLKLGCDTLFQIGYEAARLNIIK